MELWVGFVYGDQLGEGTFLGAFTNKGTAIRAMSHLIDADPVDPHHNTVVDWEQDDNGRQAQVYVITVDKEVNSTI